MVDGPAGVAGRRWWAGLPTQTSAGGTSPRTSEPIPISDQSPTVTPSRMTAADPTYTPSPIVTAACEPHTCAERGERADAVVVGEHAVGHDGDVLADRDVGGRHRPREDDRSRPDGRAVADRGRWVDDGREAITVSSEALDHVLARRVVARDCRCTRRRGRRRGRRARRRGRARGGRSTVVPCRLRIVVEEAEQLPPGLDRVDRPTRRRPSPGRSRRLRRSAGVRWTSQCSGAAGQRAADDVDDAVLVGLGEIVEQRQDQRVPRQPLGHRERHGVARRRRPARGGWP